MSHAMILTALQTSAQQSQSPRAMGTPTRGGDSPIRTSTTRLFRMDSHKSHVARNEDASNVKPRMTRSNSTSSVQSTPFKSKRNKATSGAITLFKSFSSAAFKGVSLDEESIEYDWGAERRASLFARDVVELQTENPGFEAEAYTMEQWEKDVLTAYPNRQWEMSGEEVMAWMEKAEAVRRRFVYKPPTASNGSLISPHPVNEVPYPLSYDKVALRNDRHAYELLRRIYYDLPSIHGLQLAVKPPMVALDLGCGDGSWILDAAKCWSGTRFYGIDVQRVHPSHEEIVEGYGEQLAQRVKFVTFNFLSDKLPFVDGAFEMVRMANLKWCIPANKWEDVLQEVRRVTVCGGLVEIIDDDFVVYTDPDHTLTDKASESCQVLESYFAELLDARNLCLETHGLMVETLQKVFSRFHGDVLPVAISPDTGVMPLRASHKNKGGSSYFVTSKSAGKRSSGASKLSGRTRSGSNSSNATLYSRGGGNDMSYFDMTSEEPLALDDSRPLPRRPHPFGLVVLDRFIPCGVDEIFAYATKNMQAVLSAGEAIQGYVLGNDPLTRWDPRTSETTSEDRQMARDWKSAQTEFEDLRWTYESAMSERLNANIGPVNFNVSDSVDDVEETSSKPDPPRPVSTIGQIPNDESWNGDVEQLARIMSQNGLGKLVRAIRVYTMWK